MTRPNFIVIGPGKTGTTWLYKCLQEHPQIKLARNTKETLFFNREYDRGIGWYENFFGGADDARAVGEVSNDYFFSPEAPARIAKHLPDVKLITMLRNPVDRLISQYQFNIRNGNYTVFNLPARITIEESIEHVPLMIEMNEYQPYLENYLKHFSRDQIFVGLYDDVRDEPDRLIREIFAFIGVDPDFVPSSLRTRVLAASQARSMNGMQYAKRVSNWLRRNQLYSLLTWAKTNPAVLKILTKPVDRNSEVAPATRENLARIFAPHVRYVESLTGRKLAHWK